MGQNDFSQGFTGNPLLRLIFQPLTGAQIRDDLAALPAGESCWTAAAVTENSSWHSGQETRFVNFPAVLASCWEILENGDWESTWNFDANPVGILFWPVKPSLKKCQNVKKSTLLQNCQIPKSRNVHVAAENSHRVFHKAGEHFRELTYTK